MTIGYAPPPPTVSFGWFGTVWGGSRGTIPKPRRCKLLFSSWKKTPYRMKRELFIPPFLLGPKGSIARRYEIPSGPQVFLHNAPEKGKRSLRRG